jgi:hypothetical protein
MAWYPSAWAMWLLPVPGGPINKTSRGSRMNRPVARSKIFELLEKIDLRLWLNFATNQKGTRQVQVLTGGIMTTGPCEPPVQPYGAHKSHGGRPSTAMRSPNLSLEAVGVAEAPPAVSGSQAEAVSFTKVNRGDKI